MVDSNKRRSADFPVRSNSGSSTAPKNSATLGSCRLRRTGDAHRLGVKIAHSCFDSVKEHNRVKSLILVLAETFSLASVVRKPSSFFSLGICGRSFLTKSQ